MAQLSWPFENIDTSEAQFSLWARNLGEGVIDGRGFELEPFADSTGMNIKVKTGQALVRGHFYDNTAQETVTIPTANLTNPRIDLVVLRLDPTANTILLHVIEGTPSSSPVAPTPTQTDGAIYDLPIARVAVGAAVATIAPANVTDLRQIFSQFTGFIDGSKIQNSITVATIPGSSVTGSITTATLPTANLTGTISAGLITTGASDKSANYTLQSSDENTFIRSTGSAITITIPDVLANGESVNFIQAGTGRITFLGSGVTLNSKEGNLKTTAQFSGATVTKIGGAYYVIGDLTA